MMNYEDQCKCLSEGYWKFWNNEEQARIDADIEKYEGDYRMILKAGIYKVREDANLGKNENVQSFFKKLFISEKRNSTY